MARRAVKPMKAGSFRDSVAKTVRMLTRSSVDVQFRGFKPHVLTRGDKVVRMVLPEVGDEAGEELILAMNGYVDHECGHIFFTPFKRAADSLQGLGRGEAKMRQQFNNIIEDIRLEKLLPRELPGTKENLERMYDAVMESYFGHHVQKALAAGAPPEELLSKCIVIGFRGLAGQKAFANYMDTHNLWQWLTPLTSRMPTFAKELQEMETYDDVERIVSMVLAAMEPKMRKKAEEAMENTPDEDIPGIDQRSEEEKQDEQGEQDDGQSQSDAPEQGQEPGGDGDDSQDAPEQEQDGGDAGDDEGNSSQGDDADEGDTGGADDESDDTGGEGHGDGEGTDDGNPNDEPEGDSSSDEQGGDDDGAGDQKDDDQEDKGGPEKDSDSERETNTTITEALKKLEATQRKAIFLHKKKKQSVTQIAERLKMSEDEVKATLSEARRNLAEIMGS